MSAAAQLSDLCLSIEDELLSPHRRDWSTATERRRHRRSATEVLFCRVSADNDLSDGRASACLVVMHELLRLGHSDPDGDHVQADQITSKLPAVHGALPESRPSREAKKRSLVTVGKR